MEGPLSTHGMCPRHIQDTQTPFLKPIPFTTRPLMRRPLVSVCLSVRRRTSGRWPPALRRSWRS
jgi:hypothetical protein